MYSSRFHPKVISLHLIGETLDTGHWTLDTGQSSLIIASKINQDERRIRKIE